MSASISKSGQENKPIQCFFRISVGGEILAKDIVIELDMENYPKTCASFLSLCDAKDSDSRTSKQSPQPTYRGCEFHRVVPGLCVQAGDWERFDGTGGFSPLYGRHWNDEEAKSASKKYNKHDREGIVSMANTGKPNTNGSQFFVTLKPTPHLDRKHTAFGKVVSGMESVRKMADVERGEKDRPVSLQRVVVEDCGRFGIEHGSSKRETEEKDSDRSRSKEHKRRKKSRKREKKKREKKRHRSRRHESSGSESYSSDDSDSHSDDSDSERDQRRRRERRSRKHRDRKRRRKRYDSSNDDESSSDDGNSRGQKHKRRRSSRDARDRRDGKKKETEKSRR